MQALETNEGGHLRCGNTLKKLEKMEKYGPNAKVAVHGLNYGEIWAKYIKILFLHNWQYYIQLIPPPTLGTAVLKWISCQLSP
jgi:hypothetical protein